MINPVSPKHMGFRPLAISTECKFLSPLGYRFAGFLLQGMMAPATFTSRFMGSTLPAKQQGTIVRIIIIVIRIRITKIIMNHKS